MRVPANSMSYTPQPRTDCQTRKDGGRSTTRRTPMAWNSDWRAFPLARSNAPLALDTDHTRRLLRAVSNTDATQALDPLLCLHPIYTAPIDQTEVTVAGAATAPELCQERPITLSHHRKPKKTLSIDPITFGIMTSKCPREKVRFLAQTQYRTVPCCFSPAQVPQR